MADIAKIKQRLDKAENALHLLAMGEKVVMVAYSLDGTNQRQFNQTSIPQLESYIARLQAQIARSEGRGRRPIYLA